jgi:hypothetical protein
MDFIEKGLHKLIASKDERALLQIGLKGADELLGASAIIEDGQLVIQTFHMDIEQFPDASAALGVLYKHGATAAIEEMTKHPSGEKDYWVSYRINCGSDVKAAAAALRELILQKYPNADLSDFVAEVMEA